MENRALTGNAVKPPTPATEGQTLEDSRLLRAVLSEMSEVIVGQAHMNRALLMGLVTGGHVLLEGLPGLAKTLAVRTLASLMHAKFQRVQFTPDLLPSDLIGTMIYREQLGDFVPKKGPIFANILLADEINRAPAKVQSALLEAMAEKQVTIGETTYPLEEPFLVLATQNPIEQEGTYPLPEAQLDRFMFKVRIYYPTRDDERAILARMGGHAELVQPKPLFKTSEILAVRKRLDGVFVDDSLNEYILRLVAATRRGEEMLTSEADPNRLRDVRNSIQIGASPRATLYLQRASRAHALLEGRAFVTPDDIKAVTYEILRHRIIPTFEAESRNVSTDDLVALLLETVTVP